jgi:hypothetical protein
MEQIGSRYQSKKSAICVTAISFLGSYNTPMANTAYFIIDIMLCGPPSTASRFFVGIFKDGYMKSSAGCAAKMAWTSSVALYQRIMSTSSSQYHTTFVD